MNSNDEKTEDRKSFDPMTSSVGTIDDDDFHFHMAMLINASRREDDADYGKFRRQFITHIDARIAEARQQGHIEGFDRAWAECNRQAAAIGAPLATPAAALTGMQVSLDVSRGDEDATNRIFGEVVGVQDSNTGPVILAVESSRNFATPAAAAPKAVELPEPDTMHYAPYQGALVKYHSPDQIIEFANARARAAVALAVTQEKK